MQAWMLQVYPKTPVFVQKMGIAGFGWYWKRRRFGGVYEQELKEITERERWSPELMESYVTTRLREQLLRAYDEVPFYRDAFSAAGLSREDLSGFTRADLGRLPILEKKNLRADSAIILTEEARRDLPATYCTSGTTGTPIKVFWNSKTHQKNLAYREARSFRWAGVSYEGSRASLAMRPVVAASQATPPFWRYNPWEKQLYLSLFHVGPGTVESYVAEINERKPDAFTGFVSAWYELACLIRERGLKVWQPKALITTSEQLLPHMRETLESVFGAPVFEEYGMVENCSLGTQCEYGKLHISLDFGITEIVRADGSPTEPGEPGRVLLTGLANDSQLFIRYDIGDQAAWDGEKCSCGRDALPTFRELFGREEDAVLLPDGRRTPRFDFLFKDLPGVMEAQVVQEKAAELRVKIVPSKTHTDADYSTIRTRFAARIGGNMELRFEIVPSIPREKNGKFRPVVSSYAKTVARA